MPVGSLNPSVITLTRAPVEAKNSVTEGCVSTPAFVPASVTQTSVPFDAMAEGALN